MSLVFFEDSFSATKDDLEGSKAFLASNMDTVPSKLFLRALTAEKLSSQSKNNLVKVLHNEYISAIANSIVSSLYRWRK